MWGERIIRLGCRSSTTEEGFNGTAHPGTMTACVHVRSQASSLIGSVRLQGDPLACSKVDKHACLSPGRLAGFRNPKSSIDTRRFAQGGLVQWIPHSREQTMLNASLGRSN